MRDYLKQTCLLWILFINIGTVHAQKNSYDHYRSVFSSRPSNSLLLFGSVQSIQIEDSFFITDVFTNTVKINYTAHRYFYDVNRETTRELQLRAPLDTSYDIEFLNHETLFIKKGTWHQPYERTWTEIAPLPTNRVNP